MSALHRKSAFGLALALLLAVSPGAVRAEEAPLVPGLKEAIQQFDAAIAENPYAADAYLRRGVAHRNNKDFTAALADYDRALELDPKHAGALNAKAWLRATCSDEAFRNPKEALHLAEQAVRITTIADYLDTLAAAFAANDRFEDAAETVQKAITMNEQENGPLPALAAYRLHLQAYNDKKPWRQ